MGGEMTSLSVAIVIAAVVVGGSLLLSGRYQVVQTGYPGIAWRINDRTGDVLVCYTPAAGSPGRCSGPLVVNHQTEGR